MNEKQPFRERIWQRIDADRDVGRPPGAQGRIPNFAGAEAAASRLAELIEWQRARVVKVNPDSPQLAVRARAIEEGKLVYVPVPRLSAEVPFFALERSRLKVPALEAASIEGAARHGVPTTFDAMAAIDFIVCGTVAVNPSGVRIGKGGGYADLEFALLTELDKVSSEVTIATSVHDVQLLDEELPETRHDYRVDVIVTPTRTLRCPRWARPTGIVWEDLDADKIAAIPALVARRARRAEG